MKQQIWDFLFGDTQKGVSPKTDKGLREDSLKPSLHVTGHWTIPYRLIRAKRKTVGFIIDEDGLTVRAPKWVSREEIETMIHAREEWIRKKIEQFSKWRQQIQSVQIQFKEGDQIPYLGRRLTIRLVPHATVVERVGDDLILNLTNDTDSRRIKDLAQVWFKKEAKRYLGTRLEEMSRLAGLSYNRWGISNAQGRWGSCSSRRTIRLNWRLIHLDVELIDYVIAHELAHLEEMNHGPDFWARVKNLCPQYELARNRLKRIYIPQLPFQS